MIWDWNCTSQSLEETVHFSMVINSNQQGFNVIWFPVWKQALALCNLAVERNLFSFTEVNRRDPVTFLTSNLSTKRTCPFILAITCDSKMLLQAKARNSKPPHLCVVNKSSACVSSLICKSVTCSAKGTYHFDSRKDNKSIPIIHCYCYTDEWYELLMHYQWTILIRAFLRHFTEASSFNVRHVWFLFTRHYSPIYI